MRAPTTDLVPITEYHPDVCQLRKFTLRYNSDFGWREIVKLANPLIAKACHSSLGSASLLASEGFLVVPALLRCLFEFFCDGRIHLR